MQIPDIQVIERQLQITEVLNRRGDLSTFVVHMTRDFSDNDSARQRLERIIADRTIRLGNPRGWASG